MTEEAKGRLRDIDRRDKAIVAMDKIMALGKKMDAAEQAWMDDPWDGETPGRDEDRNHRLRERFFNAEKAVSEAIPKFLKIVGVDGFV